MLRWPRDFMPEAADRRVITMAGYKSDGVNLLELVLDDDSVVICGGIEAAD